MINTKPYENLAYEVIGVATRINDIDSVKEFIEEFNPELSKDSLEVVNLNNGYELDLESGLISKTLEVSGVKVEYSYPTANATLLGELLDFLEGNL